MSMTAVLLIGVLAVVLLGIFVVLSVYELGRGGRPAPAAATTADVGPAPGARRSGPLRILLATDGSLCSQRAVGSVVARPWPAGSSVEIVTVVHTRVRLHVSRGTGQKRLRHGPVS